MIDIKKVKEITEIKERNVGMIDKIDGCHGMDVGLKVTDGKVTDEVCVRYYVRKKKPVNQLSKNEIIPREIDGMNTDIIESDEVSIQIVRQDELEQDKSRKSRWRPICGGISNGHPLTTAGSTSCMVLYDGDRCLLNNTHVAAPFWAGAKIGDPTIQPGRVDGGGLRDEVGKLVAYKEIYFDGRDNKVDAAITKLTNDSMMIPEIVGLGKPLGEVEPTLGMLVVKSGRTTRIRDGVITGIHATLNVNYGNGNIAKFVDQIITTEMSQGGDSGSCGLKKDSMKVFGLLFAGSPTLTVFNRWTDVKKAFGCELYLEDGDGGDDSECNVHKIDVRMEREVDDKLWKVYGNIVDDTDGSPVGDVIVHLLVKKVSEIVTYSDVSSDADGNWEYAGIEDGSYGLIFEKEGYVVKEVSFTLPSDEESESFDSSVISYSTTLYNVYRISI